MNIPIELNEMDLYQNKFELNPIVSISFFYEISCGDKSYKKHGHASHELASI